MIGQEEGGLAKAWDDGKGPVSQGLGQDTPCGCPMRRHQAIGTITGRRVLIAWTILPQTVSPADSSLQVDADMKAAKLISDSFRMERRNGDRQLKCKAYYFDNREAVTFHKDGFIGFAGWADDINVQPILRGLSIGSWRSGRPEYRGRPFAKGSAGYHGIKVGFHLMLTSAAKSSINPPTCNPGVFDMTRDEAEALMHRVLPHFTSKRVSRLTGKGQRVVQRWLAGEETIGLSTFSILQSQATALEATGLAAKLRALLDEAQKGGGSPQELHPETIASHLAAEYVRITGRDIE